MIRLQDQSMKSAEYDIMFKFLLTSCIEKLLLKLCTNDDGMEAWMDLMNIGYFVIDVASKRKKRNKERWKTRSLTHFCPIFLQF